MGKEARIYIYIYTYKEQLFLFEKFYQKKIITYLIKVPVITEYL